MNTAHHNQTAILTPTRAEKHRMSIVLVEIIVLLLAVFLQNAQAQQLQPIHTNNVESSRDVWVYAHGDYLYLWDTATMNEADSLPLMPLQQQLLWSGNTRETMTATDIIARYDEFEYAPLPGELIGSFEVSGELSVTHLDDHHIRVDYRAGELLLMTYGGTP